MRLRVYGGTRSKGGEVSAWNDYMKEHGKEEYAAWESAMKPLTDKVDEQQAEIATLRAQLERAEADTRRLREALTGALKLPRPWIDGGITFEAWSKAFDDIDAAHSPIQGASMSQPDRERALELVKMALSCGFLSHNFTEDQVADAMLEFSAQEADRRPEHKSLVELGNAGARESRAAELRSQKSKETDT